MKMSICLLRDKLSLSQSSSLPSKTMAHGGCGGVGLFTFSVPNCLLFVRNFVNERGCFIKIAHWRDREINDHMGQLHLPVSLGPAVWSSAPFSLSSFEWGLKRLSFDFFGSESSLTLLLPLHSTVHPHSTHYYNSICVSVYNTYPLFWFSTLSYYIYLCPKSLLIVLLSKCFVQDHRISGLFMLHGLSVKQFSKLITRKFLIYI